MSSSAPLTRANRVHDVHGDCTRVERWDEESSRDRECNRRALARGRPLGASVSRARGTAPACQGTGLSRRAARASGRRDPRARAAGRRDGRAGSCGAAPPAREPSCGPTTRPVRARRWTRRPRRPIGRAWTSCARSSSRPATGRMTSARRGPRRSSTSSPASWPARSASAAATGPPPPRPSARARTSGAGCTRPCARSPRRCLSSAGISSARSTRARRARIAPLPSRRSRFCPRRPRCRQATVAIMLTAVEDTAAASRRGAATSGS